MSKTYSDKLKDPRWQKRRLRVMERDDWKCRDCRNHRSQLHVHHCYYIPGVDPWDQPEEAMLTLCDECHVDRQSREVALHVTLAKILAATPVCQIEAMFWCLLGRCAEIEREQNAEAVDA